MHNIYALLLPSNRDPEDILIEAENIVQEVGDEGNHYAFIGLALPGREIVDPASYLFPLSDYWNIHKLASEVNGYWLTYVSSLEYQEVADVLGLHPDGARIIQQIMEQDGKEAVIEKLAAVVVNPAEEGHRRRRAAQRLTIVLDDKWPFPERLDSWYRQRVFKHQGVTPEEAAIVLVDIHT